MRRPLARWTVPALTAAVLTLVVPGAAAAKTRHQPERKPAKEQVRHKHVTKKKQVSMAAVTRLRREVAWHRSHAWKLQDEIGVTRTKTSGHEARTISVAYLHWLVRLWNQRRIDARVRADQFEREWRSMSRDFETAVRVLAARLRLGANMANWVLSCADSEGGRGAWVPNRGGSGAGGWMQFLSGTYYSNSPAAWRFAASRGVNVPRKHDSWYSPVGQALTALYMFSTQGSGQWYGSGC